MTEDQIIALHSETSSNTIRALCALALEALELRAENERLKENLMDAQGEIHYLKNRAEF
jgi:cell division protein FtsB